MDVHRGDVVIADLDPVKGSEQGNRRPALVIQNDVGNEYSPTTIIAPITSSYEKVYPVNVEVDAGEGELDKDSIVLLNQIRTVSIDHRVKEKLGRLEVETMETVDEAIERSLGLTAV